MSRMPCWSVVSSLIVATLLPFAGAQAPPSPFAGSRTTGSSVAANERFVFVVFEGVLYKFDVESLQLLGSAPLGQAQVGRPAVEPGRIGQEPPPPPPEPAAVPTPYDQTITDALAWLVARQDDNGRWDADGFMKHDGEGAPCDGAGSPVHDVGVTALACLALLADGNTLRQGRHKNALKKAIVWLREQQQDNGLVGTPASHDFIYDHAIATVALTEAFGLSNYNLLKRNAQQAINYLESHRNPYSVWRYQPRDNDNDTSVTTWAAWGYASAKSFGLEVNETALQCVSTWYDQVTDANGRTGYTKAGERSSRMPGDHAARFPVENGEALTAAGLFGRFLLGQTPQQKPVMNAAADLLLAHPPRWVQDSIDPYYWMFGTMAMYQMGGDSWRQWQGNLREITNAQRHDGNCAGSWDPVGVWDLNGGRVYSTAMYTLALLTAKRAARLQ